MLSSSWWLGSLPALPAYVSNFKDLSSRDSVPAALIPVALILDGTVMLDRFAAEESARFSKDPYWLDDAPRGTASVSPIMTGILATPFYALPVIRPQLRGASSSQ